MLRETGQFCGYRAEENGSDQNRRSKFKLSGGLREPGGGAGPWGGSLLGRPPASRPSTPHLPPPSSLREWKLFRFWLLRAGFLPRK